MSMLASHVDIKTRNPYNADSLDNEDNFSFSS